MKERLGLVSKFENKYPKIAYLQSELLEQLSDAIISTDLDGVVINWNRAATNLFGWEAFEVTGKALEPFVKSMYDRTSHEAVLAELKQKGIWQGEVSQEGKNGQRRKIFQILSLLSDVNGETAGYVSINRQVMEPQKSQFVLRFNDKLYKQISETTQEGVLVLDEDSRITYINNRMTEIMGYTLEEMLGHNILDLIDMNARFIVEQNIESRRKGIAGHYELQFRNKGGSTRWVSIAVSPVFNEKGQYSGSVAMISDITDRKKSELALKESEEHFRTTFEQAAVGIAHVSPNGNFLRINRKFCELVGYSHEEMLSITFQDITHPDDLNTDLELIKQMLAHEIDTYTLEKRYICKDKTQIWVQITVSMAWSEDGTPKYAIGVVENIQDRKLAEEELRNSEGRYRQLLENLSSGVVVHAPDTSIILHNRRAAELLGLSHDQMMGKTALNPEWSFTRGDGSPLPLDEYPINQVLNLQLPFESLEFGINRPVTRDRVWVMVNAFPVFDKQHEIEHVIVTFSDITQRKNAEIKLQEAERFAHSTVDALCAQIAILDEQGIILSVNKAWSTFAIDNSVEPDKVGIGINYLKVLEEVNPDSEDGEVARIMQEGIRRTLIGEIDSFTFEYSCPYPEDKTWYLAHVTRFAGDGPSRVVVAHEDISDRKKANELLAEQRYELNERVKELSCLFRQSKLMEEPGISMDAIFQGTVELIPDAWQYPNITCAQLLIEGNTYFTNNFRETPWSQSCPILIDNLLAGVLEVFYLEEKPNMYEGPFLKEERELINELARRLAYKIKTRRAEEALQQARNTLEERVVSRTAQLQAANERLEAILNNSVDGIVLVRKDFSIEQTNSAFDRLFDSKPDAYLARPLTDLLHEEQRFQITNSIQNALKGGHEVYIEVHALREDDTVFDAELGIGHIKGKGFVCVIRDITERKQAETALRKALAKEKELGELKSRFVSMASHEFRTPLAAILATTDTLSTYREKLNDTQIDTRLNKIRFQILHMTSLMEDVLQLARYQSGRVEFKPALDDLDKLCKEIIEEYESQAQFMGRISYKSSAAPLLMSFDKHLMRQVISNLVSNALKYSPIEKIVRVNLWNTATDVELTVIDEGIGIPAEDMKHLFEPFHRARNVGTISGTGLGLSITWQAILMHSGTITPVSEIGKGTSITVIFPKK